MAKASIPAEDSYFSTASKGRAFRTQEGNGVQYRELQGEPASADQYRERSLVTADGRPISTRPIRSDEGGERYPPPRTTTDGQDSFIDGRQLESDELPFFGRRRHGCRHRARQGIGSRSLWLIARRRRSHFGSEAVKKTSGRRSVQ